MSAYSAFTEALERASHIHHPPSPQHKRSVGDIARLSEAFRPAFQRDRPSIDSGKGELLQVPPNSPMNDLSAVAALETGNPRYTFENLQSRPELFSDSLEPYRNHIEEGFSQSHFATNGNHTNLQDSDDIVIESRMVPALCVEEPVQSRDHEIDALFEDDDMGPVNDSIDLMAVYDPRLKAQERSSNRDTEPYEYQNPDLVHDMQWQPHIPTGEDSWSQQSQAGSAYPENGLRTPRSATTSNIIPGLHVPPQASGNQHMMSGALPASRSRNPSPTESELIGYGFEFHSELPEDVQIAQFGNKAFRKALREVNPDLPRKQQWHAWSKVHQMLEGLGGPEDTPTGSIANSVSKGGEAMRPAIPTELRSLDEVDSRICLQAADPMSENMHSVRTPSNGSTGSGTQPQQDQPTDWSWTELGLDADDLTVESEDYIPLANRPEFTEATVAETSSHSEHDTARPSKASLAGRPFGWLIDKIADEKQSRRGSQTQPEQDLMRNSIEQEDEAIAARPFGWLIHKIAEEKQSRRDSPSETEQFLLRHSVEQEAEIRTSIEVPIAVARLMRNPVPIAPSLSQTELTPQPDTPRPPFDPSIRQSIEPEASRYWVARESTPAYEDRSPSPSPPGRNNDIDMLDVSDYDPHARHHHLPPMPSAQQINPTSHYRRYSPYSSSPDPLSSPMHGVVTAPQTPLAHTSPYQPPSTIAYTSMTSTLSPPHLRDARGVNIPTNIPIPPIPAPPATHTPRSAKRTNAANKNRRKSTTANATNSATPAGPTPSSTTTLRAVSTKIAKPPRSGHHTTNTTNSRSVTQSTVRKVTAKFNAKLKKAEEIFTRRQDRENSIEPSASAAGGDKSTNSGRSQRTGSGRVKDAVDKIEGVVRKASGEDGGRGEREGTPRTMARRSARIREKVVRKSLEGGAGGV